MKKIVLLVLLIYIINPLFAQFTEQEQTTIFSTRAESPIKIIVLKKENKFLFYADNKSYYPYSLRMIYTLTNLRPMVTEKTYVVGPGRTRLEAFEIRDENAPTNYSYKYGFLMHGTGEDFIKDYPYLFPLGKNKTASEYYSESSLPNNIRLENLNESDTIYCMRKGVVSAKPNVTVLIDKISSSKNAVEIVHEDGSVMVYKGIDQENIFVSIGEKVYPGQAIGLISWQHLSVDLYTIAEGGRITSEVIKFYSSQSENVKTLGEFDDEVSEYPLEIIIKEMSSFEKRKLKKGKLY